MIQVEEVPDINFINFSDARLTGHTVTVTDTVDSSYIVLEIETTEASELELVI